MPCLKHRLHLRLHPIHADDAKGVIVWKQDYEGHFRHGCTILLFQHNAVDIELYGIVPVVGVGQMVQGWQAALPDILITYLLRPFPIVDCQGSIGFFENHVDGSRQFNVLLEHQPLCAQWLKSLGIRSNISTIIDYNLLYKYLPTDSSIPIYTGKINTLTWIDEACGITQSKLNEINGLKYITGIAIIMSKNMVTLIMNNKSKFDYTLIDDVSIGKLLQDINIIPYDANMYYTENASRADYSHVLYRNKSNSRVDDITNMRQISQQLLAGK